MGQKHSSPSRTLKGREASDPSNQVTLSCHEDRDPSNQVTLPHHEASVPSKQVTLSCREARDLSNQVTLSCREASNPSDQVTLPPHEDRDPSNQVTLPPHEDRDPSNQVTLPRHEASSLSNQVTLPHHEARDPSNQVTLPHHEASVPSNQVILSPHEASNPSNQVTLPHHEASVPSNQVILSCREDRDLSNQVTLPHHEDRDPSNQVTLPHNGGRNPSDVFREHFAELAESIQDPDGLACKLYSKKMITWAVRDNVVMPMLTKQQKSTILLQAVESKLTTDPSGFTTLITVLQSDPTLVPLATRMLQMYTGSLQCTMSPLVTSEPAPMLPSTSENNESPGAASNVTYREWPPSCSKWLVNQTKGGKSSCSQKPHSSSSPTTSTETHNEPRDVTELPPPSKRVKVFPTRHHLISNFQEPLEHVSTQTEIAPSDIPVEPPSGVAPNVAHVQTPPNDTPIDVYASYLKSVYQRQVFPTYRKWPPSPSKQYINLAVVKRERVSKEEADKFTRATIHGDIDDIVRKKGSISMAQIATPRQGVWPKFILVEGAPGVGKSTFSWTMCREWSKGKILQHYRLVVLLRLREKKVQEARSISDLFRCYNRQIQQKVAEEIEQSGGKGVLLLIEGFDELPTKLRTENSFFLDVIQGDVLPEATVLVTSRPSASEVLRENDENISQHIEIVGFTSENVQSYLESTLGSDPSLLSGIQKYLECYPHIRSMMYIPLNSAIVTEVYRTSKDKGVVPKTKTELYSSLMRSLLLRYLHDHPVYGKQKWRIRGFSDLPPDVYKQLCELGRIAYEGIIQGQQVIFSDLPDDFETLGLMQCVPELYVDEGATVSHNFLHLTVQEYMAALYLSQQPVETQMEHFRHYQKVHWRWSHMKVMLLFLAGLTQFSGYSTDHLRLLFRDADESDEDSSGDFESDEVSSVQVPISLDVLHWIFESQDTVLDSSILGSSLVEFSLNEIKMAPFDYFVLGYCISHSSCSWNIDLDEFDFGAAHIGDEGVEMLVRGTLECQLQFTGSISCLSMVHNDITSEGLKYLMKLPKHLLEKLDLCGNELDSESCRLLSHSIPAMTSLKSLDLLHNPIGNGGSVPLIRSLCTLNYFKEINLHNTGLGVEDCRALSELLSSSASLEKLDIDDNDLPLEAVELIISGLHHNTGLKVLDMGRSEPSTEHCVSLATVLKQNHSLVGLYVYGCGIGSEGASHLAAALCTNDTLQDLGMNCNPIGVKGATAFSEMLTHNKSLKYLYLSDDSIGEEGTRKLITSLTRNTTLEELMLPERYQSHFTSSEEYGRVKGRIMWGE